MTIIEWPTLDQFLTEVQHLLYLVAHWMLSSGYGPAVLVTILVLLVLWAVSVIRGFGNYDDPINFKEIERR